MESKLRKIFFDMIFYKDLRNSNFFCAEFAVMHARLSVEAI